MIFDPPRNPGEVREQLQAVWLFSAKPAANKHLILKLGDSQSVHGTPASAASVPFTYINKKHIRAYMWTMMLRIRRRFGSDL